MAGTGFYGDFFVPPPVPAGKRYPAVLIIGGSQGGLSSVILAAALASHGYPALAIAYFDAPGLPASLQLVGPPGSEEQLLALGRVIETAVAAR